jgi:neutral ceramidase
MLNRVILRLSLVCVAASAFMCGVVCAEDAFRAACVQVDITPERPQWLQGYGQRLSEGVHDRLYHRIAAMDDGETQFFLVSTDVCVFTPAFYDDFCEQLEDETGIQREQVWWCATHTHSAPHLGPNGIEQLFTKTLGDRFSYEPDVAYWNRVTGALIEGIKKARAQLEPARLGIGVGESFANINRRGTNDRGESVLGQDPDAPVDRQLGVLRLERPDGTLIGLVANYAIHGTVLGGANKLISGDVTGIVAAYVEEKTGAPMLFINGAEGNIAPIYSTRPDFASSRIEEFEGLLGDKILETNEAIERTTSDVQFQINETRIATPRKEGLGWLEELADYAAVNAEGEWSVLVPAYTLIINGETLIWAAPLEMFCEIALNVRAASPFKNTFFFGLTNGTLMYMPTAKAFAEGGYEPNVSPFTPKVEADYTNGVTAFIRGLHADRAVDTKR